VLAGIEIRHMVRKGQSAVDCAIVTTGFPRGRMRLIADIACATDGASAFIRAAKHAIERAQRQLVDFCRMAGI
jgi:hypothetical protein